MIKIKTEHCLISVLLVMAVALFLGLMLVGSPSHNSVTVEDGSKAWLVTCREQGACISESSKACPGGYTGLEAGDDYRLIRCK